MNCLTIGMAEKLITNLLMNSAINLRKNLHGIFSTIFDADCDINRS